MINRQGRIHVQKKASSSQENNSFDDGERMLDEIQLVRTKNQINSNLRKPKFENDCRAFSGYIFCLLISLCHEVIDWIFRSSKTQSCGWRTRAKKAPIFK